MSNVLHVWLESKYCGNPVRVVALASNLTPLPQSVRDMIDHAAKTTKPEQSEYWTWDAIEKRRREHG